MSRQVQVPRLPSHAASSARPLPQAHVCVSSRGLSRPWLRRSPEGVASFAACKCWSEEEVRVQVNWINDDGAGAMGAQGRDRGPALGLRRAVLARGPKNMEEFMLKAMGQKLQGREGVQ